MHPIDKIYLYAKDIHEPNIKYLINKIEKAGIKNSDDPKAFMEYSDDMDDVLDDINNYNKNRDKKVLIVFDDMIADIEYNKKFKKIIKELFYRARKINVSIAFITQSYFRALKEFLTRKDLKYKPNALDKARFEFSPLGKAFSTGLDKTVQGYQGEGDIRDGLKGGIIRPNNRTNNDNGDDDDRPDRPDRPDDRPDRPDGALGIVFLNNLNTNLNNIQSNSEHYARLIANQNATIKKLEEEIKDKKI